MKTTIAKLIPIAVVAIIAGAISITAPSCKKEECYECKHYDQSGAVDGTWNMCDEDTHKQAVQNGYQCTKK